MDTEIRTAYAVRERDNLRCWFRKKGKHGVFLDSSQSKARKYKTRQGALTAANLLNRKGFEYKDGTPYVFEAVEVAV